MSIESGLVSSILERLDAVATTKSAGTFDVFLEPWSPLRFMCSSERVSSQLVGSLGIYWEGLRMLGGLVAELMLSVSESGGIKGGLRRAFSVTVGDSKLFWCRSPTGWLWMLSEVLGFESANVCVSASSAFKWRVGTISSE